MIEPNNQKARTKISSPPPFPPYLPPSFSRYNANRAALVQSRIKALEKLEVVEAPEDDAQFRFHLPTPEPLGRPVINIERVSFGYPKREPGASVEDEEGKKKKKKPVEGEGGGEDGKEGGEAVPPPVPVPMLLRPPVEMGKILFENVDFGVDLETRIGKEKGRAGGGRGRGGGGCFAAVNVICSCTGSHVHTHLPPPLLPSIPSFLQVSSVPTVPANLPCSTSSLTSSVLRRAISSDITTCVWLPSPSTTGISLTCVCRRWRILRRCFLRAISRYVFVLAYPPFYIFCAL